MPPALSRPRASVRRELVAATRIRPWPRRRLLLRAAPEGPYAGRRVELVAVGALALEQGQEVVPRSAHEMQAMEQAAQGRRARRRRGVALQARLRDRLAGHLDLRVISCERDLHGRERPWRTRPPPRSDWHQRQAEPRRGRGAGGGYRPSRSSRGQGSAIVADPRRFRGSRPRQAGAPIHDGMLIRGWWPGIVPSLGTRSAANGR